MKVKDVMTFNPITLSTNSTLKDGAEVFSNSHIDSTPVVDDRFRLVGIFSKLHLFEAIKEGKSSNTLIKDLMSTKVACIQEEEDTNIVFDKKEEKFPIVSKNNKLVGILTKTDLLKSYYKKLEYTVKNLNAILSSTNNGIIAIDSSSRITFFNKAAGRILGKDSNAFLGKSILEIMETSRLPYILETGEKEIGETMGYNNKKIITNRTPIMHEGRVIGAVAVFQDITDYDNLLEELDIQKNVTDVLKTILDIAYDGIVVVDEKGYITMISKAYTKFLGVEEKEVIGKFVGDVIENTRMHIVVKTGRAEIADLHKIKGDYMIATRIPIIKNGEVLGAVGKVLFRKVEDLNILHKRISKMDEELAHYKGEVKNANCAYYSFDSIIGNSKEINAAKTLGEKASHSKSNVLLLGESGTGKELFVHAIHKKK